MDREAPGVRRVAAGRGGRFRSDVGTQCRRRLMRRADAQVSSRYRNLPKEVGDMTQVEGRGGTGDVAEHSCGEAGDTRFGSGLGQCRPTASGQLCFTQRLHSSVVAKI